jgi:hypothetical protein
MQQQRGVLLLGAGRGRGAGAERAEGELKEGADGPEGPEAVCRAEREERGQGRGAEALRTYVVLADAVGY